MRRALMLRLMPFTPRMPSVAQRRRRVYALLLSMMIARALLPYAMLRSAMRAALLIY